MNKPNGKKQKKLARHVITFEGTRDPRRVAVRMAMADQSTKRIMLVTGLSAHQVTYALDKARREGEYPKTFRQQWKSGRSPLYISFMDDHQAIMDAEIDRRIVPHIIHPTPETVKVNL